MSIPQWIQGTLDEFGRSAGLRGLAFSAHDAAVFRFENGVSLRFEYALERLAMLMTVPMSGDFETLTRLLTAAHPEYRLSRPVRTAYSEKHGCGIIAVFLDHSEIVLPELEHVFQELWRLSEDMLDRSAS